MRVVRIAGSVLEQAEKQGPVQALHELRFGHWICGLSLHDMRQGIP